MNQIALPSGGWLKYASFGGKVVERAGGVCPECALFRTAGVTRPRCEHHFVERTAFGLKIAEAPVKYAALLDSYKKAVNVQRVAPLNPEFSFYRVMALHGDWPNTNGDLFRWGSKTDANEPELLRLIREGCLEGKHVYQTFTGKGNYKDHNNSKVADAVGIILDAVPNHKVKGVEILIAVDRTKDPMLVRGIDSGYITDVSMGSRVAYSICTVCANVAHNEAEYCFVPGTQISMSDGTTRPIEDIGLGAEVLTSRGRHRRVVDTMVRDYSGDLVSIHAFGDGRSLDATPNHEIYLWNGTGLEKKRADTVRVGDPVAFPVNQESSNSIWAIQKKTNQSVVRFGGLILRRVDSVTRAPYSGKVYNIEVEEDHTYVANGMCVSNCTHVKNWKGQNYSGPETGWKNVLAAEDNRGVEFIEESWVTVGADTKAKHLEKIAALRKVKGAARMVEILVEAESELNKNSLCDWQKVNNLLDIGIAQAILA